MALDTPHIKCYRPISFRNVYGEQQVVPCRKCKACLSLSGQSRSLEISREASQHRFTEFITLTYSNANIPLCVPVPQILNAGTSIEEYRWIFCDKQTGVVLNEYDEYSPIKYSYEKMDYLLQKINLNGCFSYLRVRDCQLFMKRLRKYISIHFNDEKIRFYLVGEYGPQTYRAHYHLLLFHNSTPLSQNIRKVIRSCWKLGRISAELAKGDCAGYVSSYSVSKCVMPYFFNSIPFRPFSLHSTYFSNPDFAHYRKIAYEDTSVNFRERFNAVMASGEISSNGKIMRVSTPSSFLARLFPKCLGYDRKSSKQRLSMYVLYDTLTSAFGQHSVISLARRFYDYYYSGIDKEPLDSVAKILNLDDFIQRHFGLSVSAFPPDYKEDVLHYIERAIYLSKHFLQNVCNGLSPVYCLRVIEEYYNYVKQTQLSSFYEQQEIYFTDDNIDELSYLYYGSFDLEKFEKSSAHSAIINYYDEQFEKSIKKKKLNDLNKIFVYG